MSSTDNMGFTEMDDQPNMGSNPTSSGPATSSTTLGRRKRSEVWNFFIVKSSDDSKAECKFCGSMITCKNGTSSMRTHLNRCKENLDREENKRQKTVSAGNDRKTVVSASSPSPSYAKFDQEAVRMELVKLFIAGELSFRFVEHEQFRHFMSVACPRFLVPSRRTLVRDIYACFDMEKLKLKNFMTNHCGRVCLTTDTWTSIQNYSYMCLTAHFVDKNWKMQKMILNFYQVSSHSGEVIGKNIEKCLNNWGLNRVFSVTLDNASANDGAVNYIKKRLTSWNSLVLNGDYIQMRCCAHILSLVVKNGLKCIGNSIARIRAAVKYVRSSPSRAARFNDCVVQESISFRGLLCLDIETRWNSTYLMLSAALKYQKAFDLLELRDSKFVPELTKENGTGAPLDSDWDYARVVLPFLKVFYDATLRVSGTSYVTSNSYMKEVFAIGRKINQYCQSSTSSVRSMAESMKVKYAKYWGTPGRINMLLLIVVVFDPRHKQDYVTWSISQLFGKDEASALDAKLTASLKSLYEEYMSSDEGSRSQNIEHGVQMNEEEDDDPYGVNMFLQSTGRKSNFKSELDKYLKEDCEIYSSDFDILNWWKGNATQFLVLSTIAREVLAIPVSTVASESAFSTGGRVLDPYRSALSPKMVEALVCTQDWLKSSSSLSLSIEDLEEIARIEQEMTFQHEGAGSNVISLEE